MVDIQTETSTTEGIIRFRYNTDTIFNIVSERTLLRAKAVRIGDTLQNMINEWAITRDENDTFLKSLERAVYDIFPEVVKLTEEIKDSIFIDATIGPLSGGEDFDNKWSGFKIINNANFNKNTVDLVDKKIQNVLVYLILIDWYLKIGLDEEVAKNMTLKDNELIQLSNALFELRKPTFE